MPKQKTSKKQKAKYGKAEGKFLEILNNVSKDKDQRKYNINKTYILIEELKNSLSKKDKQLYYVKYKFLIEELNTLT